MPSENNCIIEDVDNEVNFLNPYDFNDSDSFDSSDDDDENCVDPCENKSFVSLNENDVLEYFTFGDESLSNELANDLHEMLCGDDEVNIEASLCDLIDIELVNFHDNCLNDALYIHDLIGKDRSKERVAKAPKLPTYPWLGPPALYIGDVVSGSQGEQVYYLSDIKKRNWQVVVKTKPCDFYDLLDDVVGDEPCQENENFDFTIQGSKLEDNNNVIQYLIGLI
nr:hypothetical protein Iba_chr03cCG1740 [Ipomoea batatas]